MPLLLIGCLARTEVDALCPEFSAPADIDGPLAGPEAVDAKGVAGAGERRDRAFGKTFQPVVVVAEHAGEWTTGVEVIASPRILRHRRVFLLDGLTQKSQVKIYSGVKRGVDNDSLYACPDEVRETALASS